MSMPKDVLVEIGLRLPQLGLFSLVQTCKAALALTDSGLLWPCNSTLFDGLELSARQKYVQAALLREIRHAPRLLGEVLHLTEKGGCRNTNGESNEVYTSMEGFLDSSVRRTALVVKGRLLAACCGTSVHPVYATDEALYSGPGEAGLLLVSVAGSYYTTENALVYVFGTTPSIPADTTIEIAVRMTKLSETKTMYVCILTDGKPLAVVHSVKGTLALGVCTVRGIPCLARLHANHKSKEFIRQALRPFMCE